MDDLSKFLESHKNIAKIFSKEWFEFELQKSPETMHVLAKQFTFDDSSRDNAISNHLFGHLEENLVLLTDEIQRKRVIIREIKKTDEYQSINGQIEICSFFKKLGFDVELEPNVPESTKKADIKISKGDFLAYVEVRTLYVREGELMPSMPNVTIRKMNNHPLLTLQERIKQKSQQLSKFHPGIIAFNLYNISPTSHIEVAFYSIAQECPIISGLFLYRHFFNSEGCHVLMKYLRNPYANKPIPEQVERKFEKNRVDICSRTKEEIAVFEGSGK